MRVAFPAVSILLGTAFLDCAVTALVIDELGDDYSSFDPTKLLVNRPTDDEEKTVPVARTWNYRNLKDWTSVPDQMCDHTDDQSPINIRSRCVDYGGDLSKITFFYDHSVNHGKVEPETNRHTWEVVFPSGQATILANGKEFILTQFHFHSPSENTIDGKYYSMEVHMVHKGADGELLVVAQMFEAGVFSIPNPFLISFWSSFPLSAGKGFPISGSDPYEGLLARDRTYYTWSGSLTTPPCSNNVTWILMRNPVAMSQGQLDAYRVGINNVPDNQLVVEPVAPRNVTGTWDVTLGVNNRPLQELGSRVVQGLDPTHMASPLVGCD